MIRNFIYRFKRKWNCTILVMILFFSYSFSQTDCPNYFEETDITLEIGEEYTFCASIPHLERDIYSIILDGSNYTPPLEPCAEEPVVFYTYALLINQGASGPYQIESWVCADGEVHSGTVNNMAELAVLMQQWDPAGNWVHNPDTYTISGGDPADGYMNLEIIHVPTQVKAVIMRNFTTIARGSSFDFSSDTPGVYTISIVSPDDKCSDEVMITVFDPCADHTANAGENQVICFDEFATLGASGGMDYAWSPSDGLSASNIENPIASPSTTTTYTVTVTNTIGCTATDEVRVEVIEPIEISIGEMTPFDCCEGGSVTLLVKGGKGDYSFMWSDDSDNTNFGTNLNAGDYTVYVSDNSGCMGSIDFTIPNACMCPGYFMDEVVYTEPDEEVTVCVPVILQGNDIYDVIFDGSEYKGPLNPCNPAPIVFYTYALTINQGQSGPYRLDLWQCNDVLVQNIMVQDMDELTMILNQNDPTGNWTHNPATYTISGGNANDINEYGDILITHIPTNVQATIQTNFTEIEQGTELTVAGTAPGEYDLIINNPDECCNDTITLIVEADCSDLSVSANVMDANCCGENGAITLDVTGGYGDYSYKWQDDISHTGTASGLILSSYRVTVTDRFGCSQISAIEIDSNCSNCVDLIDEEVIYAEPYEEVNVCLPILLDDSKLYDILLDGSDYTTPLSACALDSIIFYTYALTINQGQSGPYRLDSWECNGTVIENMVFQDMDELAMIMNQKDPTGNWINNPSTFTISGGTMDEIGQYGTMLITHVPTNVQATIQTNFTDIADNTEVTISEGPGEYELVVGNPEDCCYDTLTIIIEADCSDLSVSANVMDANCCGENGAITLDVTGGYGDYMYRWQDDISHTSTASGLMLSSYRVTVTDKAGCSQISTIDINSNCSNCVDLIDEEVIYAEPYEEVNVCLPILLDDSKLYDIILDGSDYTAPLTACALDSIIFYTYALTINQGQSGPYRLDSWECNGTVIENMVFQDMDELAMIMNQKDPTGNWINNPSTFTISGGTMDEIDQYSTMLITHVPTNVQATIQTNFTDVPNGSEISISEGPGEYELVVGNPEDCCYDTITIIVTPDCSDLMVSADVMDANCCGENGSVTLDVTGGYGEYMFNWQNDVSDTNVASDLMSGSYKVTISDKFGCSQVGQINIESDCSSCEDIITENTIYFDEGEDAKVCVPVPFTERNIYDVIVDGSDYTQAVTRCDIDSVIYYTYALLINQGQSGPYYLDAWTCNNVSVEDIAFNNIDELVAIMNTNDPNGNWVNNPDNFTISGGADNEEYIYGGMWITHIPSQVQADIETNFTGIANGFEVDIPDAAGTYEIQIVNTEDCCTDLITVVVEDDDGGNPPNPMTSTDTIYYTTPFETPIVDICIPYQDYFDDALATIGVCGVPQNGIIANLLDGDACIYYMPEDGFSGLDEICIEVCNADGDCTAVTIVVTVEDDSTNPTEPGVDTIYYMTPHETTLTNICMPWEQFFSIGFTSINICESPLNGTIENIEDGNACFDYIPNDKFSGVDEICIEVCDDQGLCGTIIVFITVLGSDGPPTGMQDDTLFVVTPYGTPATDICVSWEQFFDTGFEGLNICNAPNNGTLINIADGDACFDYIPNMGFAGIDEICIEVCNDEGVCGTVIIVITVMGGDGPPPTGINMDTLYFITPFETPVINACMPWEQFFDTGFENLSICNAPDNGTLTNIADGDACVDYIPNMDFVGMDEFCVEVCNDEGDCGVFIVIVTVLEEDTPPNPTMQDTIYLTTPYETPILSGCMPWNVFFDSGFSMMTVCGEPMNGTLDLGNSDECWDYYPNEGFTGMDEFCVTVCNDEGVCGTFIIMVTVLEEDTPPNPTMQDTIYLTTPYETPILSGCMPWNVFFDSGFSMMTVCGEPMNGTLDLGNSDECWDYYPNEGFTGMDEFCVTVCNDEGVCGTFIIMVTVLEEDTPPNPAMQDTIYLTTPYETPILSGCMPWNVFFDSGFSMMTVCGEPMNGTLDLGNSDECWDYYPNESFTGMDEFCVTVCNDQGVCGDFIIFVMVEEPDGGEFNPDTIVDTISVNTTIDLCIDTTELQNTVVMLGMCDMPSNGIVEPSTESINCFTYTPNTDFIGVDTFCIAICDDMGVCDETTVIIHVVPVDSTECNDIIALETLTIEECNDGIADVCLPIALQQILDLTITDNGQPYEGGFAGCDFDTMFTYLFITLPGEGNAGPYTLETWSENGMLHEDVEFETIMDLVDLMNTWDSEGNWIYNEQSITISGGVSGGNYSGMSIIQNSTNTTVFIDFNIDMSPSATIFNLTEGVHTLQFTDTLNCTDEIVVTVNCSGDGSDCDDIIMQDSIFVAGMSCNNTVGVCLDIPFAESESYEIFVNGDIYDLAYQSCDDGNSTSISLMPGNYEIEVVQEMRECRDTVIATIACLTPEIMTDTIYINTSDTLCVDTQELPGTDISIINDCTDNSGELVLFEVIPETFCVSYTGVEIGEESACIVACDDYGFCDTTYIYVVVVEERDISPSIVIDVDTTYVNTPIDIDVLANDSIDNVSDIFIADQPQNGVATISPSGIVTYTPDDDYCDPQMPDVFTYTVCDDFGYCETQQVLVYVLCDELTVYTGFSPNEDGVNDFFYIEGIDAYPDTELFIFNRWGNLVYKTMNYKNDWNGTWEGRILPDGTYFYVLEDENSGLIQSGYLQLHR